MKLVIKKTSADDLENILRLWNSGEVMKYVGFPDGLNYSMDQMKEWLEYINQNADCRHYSIYEAELGYCGETYYEVDKKHDAAALDIKLLPEAQGKNIAYSALKTPSVPSSGRIWPPRFMWNLILTISWPGNYTDASVSKVLPVRSTLNLFRPTWN